MLLQVDAAFYFQNMEFFLPTLRRRASRLDSFLPSPLCKAHPFANTLLLADAVELLLSSPGHAAISGACIARICREVHHVAQTEQDSTVSREIGGLSTEQLWPQTGGDAADAICPTSLGFGAFV